MRRRFRTPFALAVAVMILGGWASAEASPAAASPETVAVATVAGTAGAPGTSAGLVLDAD